MEQSSPRKGKGREQQWDQNDKKDYVSEQYKVQSNKSSPMDILMLNIVPFNENYTTEYLL